MGIISVTSVVTVFFPLDRALQLGEQGWTPGTVAQALRLGVEIPSYARAAEVFRELTHLPLSKSTLQRMTTQYGQQVAATLAAEATAMVSVPRQEETVVWRTTPEPDSRMMNVSSDGVMIHLRGEGYKEVKTVAISAVVPRPDAQTGELTPHLTQHSYRAGVWDAPTFANHLWAEAERRGVPKAQYVVSVNDGAPWIWAIVFMCFARCVQILDWYHATQRLWTIASAYYGADHAATTQWVETQKALLAKGKLRDIWRNLASSTHADSHYPHPSTKLSFIFFIIVSVCAITNSAALAARLGPVSSSPHPKGTRNSSSKPA